MLKHGILIKKKKKSIFKAIFRYYKIIFSVSFDCRRTNSAFK